MITSTQITTLQGCVAANPTDPGTSGENVLLRMAGFLGQAGISFEFEDGVLRALGYRISVETRALEEGPDVVWANPPMILRREGPSPPLFRMPRDRGNTQWNVDDPVAAMLDALIRVAEGAAEPVQA